MTIFDIVVDGAEVLEVGAVPDSEVEADGRNFVLLAVRKPKGPWFALFRREWEDAQATLADVHTAKVKPSEVRRLSEGMVNCRVSIGFEYPCDADSRDAVSWLTIDILEEGKRKPQCVVNAELA